MGNERKIPLSFSSPRKQGSRFLSHRRDGYLVTARFGDRFLAKDAVGDAEDENRRNGPGRVFIAPVPAAHPGCVEEEAPGPLHRAVRGARGFVAADAVDRAHVARHREGRGARARVTGGPHAATRRPLLSLGARGGAWLLPCWGVRRPCWIRHGIAPSRGKQGVAATGGFGSPLGGVQLDGGRDVIPQRPYPLALAPPNVKRAPVSH